jgi:hypothetical protein
MNIGVNNDLFFENKKILQKKTKQIKNVVKKSNALTNNEIKIKNELTKIPFFSLGFHTETNNNHLYWFLFHTFQIFHRLFLLH